MMGASPDAAAVRAELERILASPAFVHAEKLSRFLRYVVEETLAGRAAQLKEPVIGIEVYDRPSAYDPRIDSTVRGEASKLRARLQAYYERNGCGGRVVISVPKGSYVPQFTVGFPDTVARPSAPHDRGNRKGIAPVTLIGRDQERRHLEQLLAEALAGQGSFALIGGEPGIGKTHLTRAIVAEARRRGCFALVGHCYEMEGAPPYVPFVEMLEYSARVVPRVAFRESLGDAAAEVARLMPELRRIFPDVGPPLELPPERQRRYLFNAYREFVERFARAAPIVAVFEDLHWADEATLLLMAHLAQAVAGVPLVMIGTYRDTEVDAARPFAGTLEGWIRERAAARLMLRRFDPAGVAEMLSTLSGRTPPAAVVSAVFEETDGNPFFVEEVFRHLREEGKLFDAQGGWLEAWPPGDLQVPPSVRLVIGRRLERLAEETRRVLVTAAVAGRSFDLGLLEDLEPGRRDPDSPASEGGEPSATLEAIEDAERAHLVVADRSGRGRETRYRFVHELVRQTLADTLSLARRQWLHARLAGAIERRHAVDLELQASALAHHFFHGGPFADLDKTIAYLLLAGRQASRGAAHEDALAHAERALSLAGEEHPRVAELHVARAIALKSLSRMAEAAEAYQRAAARYIAAGDRAGAAEASIHQGYTLLWMCDARGCEAIEQAVRLAGSEPLPLQHRLVHSKAMALAVTGRMAESLVALAEATRIEGVLPQPPADGFVRMCEARVRFAAAQLELADRCGREAWARFRQAGDLWGEAEAFEPLSAALWLGRPSEAEAMLPDFMARAERVGHQNTVWVMKRMTVTLRLAQGDLEQAQRTALEAHEFGSRIATGWLHLDHVLLGAIAHYRGRFDEALQWIRQGLDTEFFSYHRGHLSGLLFWTLAARGDAEAEPALRLAREHLPDPDLPLSLGACSCLAFVAEGLAMLGRREESAGLEDQAERVVASGPFCTFTQNLFRTSAGIASAAARHWSRAEEHFRTAIHQAGSAPYRVAQPTARAWYADMLRERGLPGDRQRARELQAEALRLYESLGMPWHARQLAARVAAP